MRGYATYTHQCPNCKHSQEIFAHGVSRYMVCNSCHKILDIQAANLKVYAEFHKPPMLEPSLKVGMEGVFNGVTYLVTGYVILRERNSPFHWVEYALYNPRKGHLVLSESAGHWNLIQRLQTAPQLKSTFNFTFEDKEYDIYHRYTCFLQYAAGEFHEDLLEYERKEFAEYVSPPYMLNVEKVDGKFFWFKAEYQSPKQIKEAFQLSRDLPKPKGVAGNQPNRLVPGRVMLKWAFILVLLATFVQLLFDITAVHQPLMSEHWNLVDHRHKANHEFVSQSFKVEGGVLGYTDLEIEMFAPVKNNWLELGVALVNEQSGEQRFFESGIEYYSGYDYSEGSQTEYRLITSVEPGNYHLNVFPAVGFYDIDTSGIVSDTLGHQTLADLAGLGLIHWSSTDEPGFQIKVVRDVTMWWNYILFCTILVIWTAIHWFRYNYMEGRRWSASDFG